MTIQEIEKCIVDTDYKFCSLWDQSNSCIETYNKTGKGIEKFDIIKKRLLSQPDGIYLIKCRNSSAGKIDIYEYKKGDQMISEKAPVTVKYLENDRILQLSIEVERLKAQLDRKEDKIQDLEKEINLLLSENNELEDKITQLETDSAPITLGEETAQPSLMESAKDFLGQLMEFGAPLLDKHFSLKEQALNLEALKIQNVKPRVRTEQDQQRAEIVAKVEAWINSKKEDPELYNKLYAIYINCGNVLKFSEMLKDNSEDLYNEFLTIV
jgi:uncharacterized small protein (DUF1192 family)